MAKTFIVILYVTLSACVDDGIRLIGESEPPSDAHIDHGTEPVQDSDLIEPDPAADESIPDLPDLDLPDVGSGDSADLAQDEGVDNCLGSRCTSDGPCNCMPSGEGECLTNLMAYVFFPGGYCTAACTSDAECGDAGRCVEIWTGTRYCLRTCTSVMDCRMGEGYECAQLPMSLDTSRYCIPLGPCCGD